MIAQRALFHSGSYYILREPPKTNTINIRASFGSNFYCNRDEIENQTSISSLPHFIDLLFLILSSFLSFK